MPTEVYRAVEMSVQSEGNPMILGQSVNRNETQNRSRCCKCCGNVAKLLRFTMILTNFLLLITFAGYLAAICTNDNIEKICIFRSSSDKEDHKEPTPHIRSVLDVKKLADTLQNEIIYWRADREHISQNSIEYKDGYFIIPRYGSYQVHFQLGIDAALTKPSSDQTDIHLCVISIRPHTSGRRIHLCHRGREHTTWAGVSQLTIGTQYFEKGERIAVTVNKSLVSSIYGDSTLSLFEMKFLS